MNKHAFLHCHYFQKPWLEVSPVQNAQSVIESLIQKLPECTESNTIIDIDPVTDAKNFVFLKQYSTKNARFVVVEHTNKAYFGFAIGIITTDEHCRDQYGLFLQNHFPKGEHDEIHASYAFVHDPYDLGQKLIAYGAACYFISEATELSILQ